MRALPAFLLVLSLSGCGGGGNDSNFPHSIDGTWRGPLRQSSCLRCNDGSTQCVGVGRLTRSISVTFVAEPLESGTTEEVSAALEDCVYTGMRNVDFPFTLTAESGCTGTMEIESIEGRSLNISLDSGPVPPAPPLGCSLTEEGVLARE